MQLKNEHIYLRVPELSDVDSIYEWENCTDNWIINNQHTPLSKEAIIDFALSNHDIYSQKQFRFMIIRENDKRLLGCIDLFEFDIKNSKCGVGIFIDQTQRNKGYGNEALKLLIDYSFSVLHLNQLYAHVPITNSSSVAIFSKNNFICNGVFKSWIRGESANFLDVSFLQRFKD
ncbi:MAG: GNAT family N-acetyltransferase [Bacteroidetes bacterium]|jgi:diamine N-acetyltransferase|nr:GNAT family N-acetyltransferase [Bacteroidota bacterium]MCA6443357.1 GNAT family N-acetyltransferase [Bacteroidota bacterium]